ncbi:hypothetical protein Tco_0505251, partial [Tanacetum coccineum]
MSSSTHPITILSDSNVEDAFSSTNTPDYTLASSNFFPASPRNTPSDSLDDLTNSHKTHLERHEEQIKTILNHLDELPLERIENMEDKIKGLGIMDMINDQDIEHTISLTPPPDYPLISYLSGRSMKPLENEPVPEKPNEMAPKRTSTSTTPTMSQAAIKKLVADSVAAALEAQAATMANTNITNRNTEPRETPVARNCSYKEFMSYQPFNFKEEALSWWNSFSQPIGIEEAYKITWSEFKKLLIKKYCPRTEVKKMGDEFYNLIRESALQKLVPKGKQQCPWKSILAEADTLTKTPNVVSFDVVIGMDWLSKYHAIIIYDEKFVHIPIDGETLIIRVMEKKSDDKRLEDIPVVREFLKVFLEDLPGLPPVRQVEFQIDLIPGAALVARAPYRLAPSEMQELSNQLQELAD